MITISTPQPSDALGIRTVLYKAWLATYPNAELGITVADIEESYKDFLTPESIAKHQQKIAEISADQKRIVAKDGDKVVGVATVVRNETNFQLRTIYILPEYHRQGIGRKLWAEALKFCDPSKDIIVQVATYNQGALAFYKSLGFVDTGKRFTEERFRMPSGAIIPEMELVLKATS